MQNKKSPVRSQGIFCFVQKRLSCTIFGRIMLIVEDIKTKDNSCEKYINLQF